jgi:hypothetical protein
MLALSHVRQFSPPLHLKQFPEIKLKPIGQFVQLAVSLHEKSGLQISPSSKNPPIQDVHFEEFVSRHSLHGNLHC